MVVLVGVDGTSDGSWAFDQEAFDQLYRLWRPDVAALCRRLLGSAEDAEDAAQEAFLRVWSARHEYSPVRPFWPWVSTIARRLCVDERRRLTRENVEPDADPETAFDATEPVPERVVVAGDELRILSRMLDELRPFERRILVRRQLHGWSYPQIAVDEDVTVEAVRGSLKRTRASLRQLFDAELRDISPGRPRGEIDLTRPARLTSTH